MSRRQKPEKFKEEKARKVLTLKPLNKTQADYLQLLKSKTLVIAHGSSGTGKSYLACINAANRLLGGDTEKIVLIRPYESVGKSVGLRPGTNEEKLLPLMQSMIQPLLEVLGEGEFTYHLKHGNIVLEALEDIRGRSYKNAVVLVDEVQNADPATIRTLVTRIGEGCQLVMMGDGIAWQKDIKGKSGLNWLLSILQSLCKEAPEYLDEDDKTRLHRDIGIVQFTREDVVRSGITKLFVKVFDDGKFNEI